MVCLNFKNNIILHVGNQKNSFPKKNDKYLLIMVLIIQII